MTMERGELGVREPKYRATMECYETDESKQVLTKHYRTCSKLRLRCDYEELGCTFEGTRESMHEHLSNRGGYHAKLVSKKAKEDKEDKKWSGRV